MAATNVSTIRDALQDLPNYQRYARALLQIEMADEHARVLGRGALLWFIHTKQPISLGDLKLAICMRLDDQDRNSRLVPKFIDIEAVSEGLLKINSHLDTICAIDGVAYIYLRNVVPLLIPEADEVIATTCLTYLLSDKATTDLATKDGGTAGPPVYELGIQNHRFQAQDDEYDSARRHPNSVLAKRPAHTSQSEDENDFLRYAIDYWGEHARECQANLKDLAITFLKCDQLWLSENFKKYLEDLRIPSSALHFVAFKGLELFVKMLLEIEGTVLDAKDHRGRTPLSWAAGEGHVTVVDILLRDELANPHARDFNGRVPLSWAAGKGHAAVVEMLIEHVWTDSDYRDSNGRTPLSWAAGEGHVDVVEILLTHKSSQSNVNAMDFNFRSPLSWAAESGRVAVVETLLKDKRIVIDDRTVIDDRYLRYRTPLSWAAGEGRVAVVKLLLGREDVYINAGVVDGHTPLYFATRLGHTEVIRLLRENGGSE